VTFIRICRSLAPERREEKRRGVVLARQSRKQRFGTGEINRKERKGRKKDFRIVGAGLKPALADLAHREIARAAETFNFGNQGGLTMKTATMRWLFLTIVMWSLSTPISASALEVGDKAPDFELPSSQGGRLKLSSFQGKKNVLIEFYVLDFTPT